MTEYFINCDRCGRYVIGHDKLCEECSKEEKEKEERRYIIDIYKTHSTNSY